jgi:hypothetical protein
MHSSEMDYYRQRIVMITIRFNRRFMHSLIVLWRNWVMRNGTTEITTTKRTQQICQMISIIRAGQIGGLC